MYRYFSRVKTETTMVVCNSLREEAIIVSTNLTVRHCQKEVSVTTSVLV